MYRLSVCLAVMILAGTRMGAVGCEVLAGHERVRLLSGAERSEFKPDAWKDLGPERPSAVVRAPLDAVPLRLGERVFTKSGPVWLHYLLNQNRSYLALFSTTARRTRRPDQSTDWAGDARSREPGGDLFVDIYRVSDAARLATVRCRGDA
jgi:hypothetical protein